MLLLPRPCPTPGCEMEADGAKRTKSANCRVQIAKCKMTAGAKVLVKCERCGRVHRQMAAEVPARCGDCGGEETRWLGR